MDPTRKLFTETVRHFHGEPGFADAAWTRDCNQAHVLTQQKFFSGSVSFSRPTNPVRDTGRLVGRGST